MQIQLDAYQAYLAAHADGSHIEEAENAMKKVKSRDLQPEEKADGKRTVPPVLPEHQLP